MTPNEPLKLYMHEQTICWDEDGGRMTVPPHVQTPRDCMTYFAGREIVFIPDPHEQDLAPDQKRAFRKKDDELHELLRQRRAEERRRIEEEKKAGAPAQGTGHLTGRWKGRVAQYTLDGRLLKTYDSARDASRQIGVGLTCVVYACRGAGRSCHGYQWRWYLGEKPATKIAPYVDGRKWKQHKKEAEL